MSITTQRGQQRHGAAPRLQRVRAALVSRDEAAALALLADNTLANLEEGESLYADAHWSVRAVAALLERGISPDGAGQDGFHAAFDCAAGGDPDALRLLLTNRRWPVCAMERFAAAEHAAERWNAGALMVLGQCGTDLAGKDGRGATLLHWAAENSDPAAEVSRFEETVSVLLEAGVSPDAQCEDGRTALLDLVDSGRTKAAMSLLAAGADPNRATPCGRSAVVAAADGLHGALLAQMVRHVGDVLVRLAFERTLMHRCAASRVRGNVAGLAACVATLLDAGVEINATDDYGLTALDLALQNGNAEAAGVLRLHGAVRRTRRRFHEVVPDWRPERAPDAPDRRAAA